MPTIKSFALSELEKLEEIMVLTDAGLAADCHTLSCQLVNKTTEYEAAMQRRYRHSEELFSVRKAIKELRDTDAS